MDRRTARPRVAAWTMLCDLARHHALVGALLGRQLEVRYRGSILGFVWTVLTPLLLMCVYGIVFRFSMRLARVHDLILLTGDRRLRNSLEVRTVF